MAYTTINKSTDHFNTVLYTGNGSNARGITGVGFRPDFVWNKGRDDTWQNILTDIVRGATKNLYSDATNGEVTDSTRLQSFDSDGFTIGTNNQINENTDTYVAWNWLAGGSQGSSNTDGSINTTYTSVNSVAGFSISKYVGTGSAGTVGHGLGVAPKMIIIKNISQTTDWVIGHQEADASNPWNKYFEFNQNAVQDNTVFNDTAPTSSVFSVGSDGKVSSGAGSHVAYCFAEKIGYSKIGKYVGNNSADGPFIYTGFKPKFVMIKNAHTATNWSITDDKRDGYNTAGNKVIYPNTNGAEDTYYPIDHLSNGFKIRLNTEGYNGDGGDYIYMAFGQSLVGSNNVPCTAR